MEGSIAEGLRLLVGAFFCLDVFLAQHFIRLLLEEYSFKEILKGIGIFILTLSLFYLVGFGLDTVWDIETGKFRHVEPVKVMPEKE